MIVATLPWLLPALGILVLLLVVAFLRHHRLTQTLTVLIHLAALATVPAALAAGTWQVTPLLTTDPLAVLACAAILATGALVAMLAGSWLQGRRADPEEFYILLLCATVGASVLVASNHLAGVLLGLEIMGVALYPLLAYPEEGRGPLEAGIKYLVLSGVAGTMILFGMALAYAGTGALDLPGLAAAMASPDQPGQILLAVGLTLLLAGLAFKLSLVPFHMWTPDVYQGAPPPVAAWLAAVGKGAVMIFLLRLFTALPMLDLPGVAVGLTVIAAVSMLAGNLLGLLSPNLVRLLAYSSIAHIGYLFVAVLAMAAAPTGLAPEAVLFYVLAYMVMSIGAFGILGSLSGANAGAGASTNLDLADMQGMFHRSPLLAALLSLMLLALAGIPLTAGFLAKFYLFAIGASAELFGLLWALVIGSAIGVFYYLRVIVTMAMPVAAGTSPTLVAPAPDRWTLGLVAVLVLWFGIWPEPVLQVLRQALPVVLPVVLPLDLP